MIRCTRNLMQILVAFLLTGCAAPAPRIAGTQFTDERVASATTVGRAVATELVITPTRVASATLTPTASPTPTGLPTATAQPTATPRATATARPTQPVPTYTPASTMTPTPAATATPEPPAVVVASAGNVRAGPGTAYPIIAGARVGQRLPVSGQRGDWWQVELSGRTGWIWGALVTPNAAAQQAPQVKDLPPLPTAEAKAEAEVKAEPTAASTLTSTLTSASSLPLPDLVVLGLETVYPVRARRFVGAGYELVDASSQYDLVLRRDVYGVVARQFWGDKLYGKHPAGIRITLLDPEAPPECAIVCQSCPGQPTIARLLAPMRLANDWRGDCYARSLQASYGDGAGATIWVGCVDDRAGALSIPTDPEECFVALAAPGPHLTDLLVSATIATYNWLVVGSYDAMTPDFSQAGFSPQLGQAYRAGDQWRWADPFVALVPARQ